MTTIRAAAVQISPALYSPKAPWTRLTRRSSSLPARVCSSRPSRKRWCRTLFFLCAAALRDGRGTPKAA
jgi:hypothetical protein